MFEGNGTVVYAVGWVLMAFLEYFDVDVWGWIRWGGVGWMKRPGCVDDGDVEFESVVMQDCNGMFDSQVSVEHSRLCLVALLGKEEET